MSGGFAARLAAGEAEGREGPGGKRQKPASPFQASAGNAEGLTVSLLGCPAAPKGAAGRDASRGAHGREPLGSLAGVSSSFLKPFQGVEGAWQFLLGRKRNYYCTGFLFSYSRGFLFTSKLM